MGIFRYDYAPPTSSYLIGLRTWNCSRLTSLRTMRGTSWTRSAVSMSHTSSTWTRESSHSTFLTVSRLDAARKLKEDFCKCSNFSHLTNCRHILQECKHMGVKINKPSEQRTFLESMDFLSKNKKKAVNMLFEEIEQEVTEKERFVT